MGSVCETIKEVIDNLDEELGLVEVHLYRPFSTKYLLNILPDTRAEKDLSLYLVINNSNSFFGCA